MAKHRPGEGRHANKRKNQGPKATPNPPRPSQAFSPVRDDYYTKTARNLWFWLRDPAGFYTDGRSGNPDVIFKNLQTILDERLGGDILRLLPSPDDEAYTVNAEGLTQPLDARHTTGVLNLAYQGLARYRRRAGLGVWKNPLAQFDDNYLSAARHAVEKGMDPTSDLRWHREKTARAQGLNPRTGMPTFSADEQRQIADIERMNRENQALHFALVTYSFAQAGEPHDLMLRKTLERIAQVGGLAVLDTFAVYSRVLLEPDTWAPVKSFLQAAERTPYDDPAYRDAETKGTAPHRTSGMGRPSPHN